MAPMLKVRGTRGLKRRKAIEVVTEVDAHVRVLSFHLQKMAVEVCSVSGTDHQIRRESATIP